MVVLLNLKYVYREPEFLSVTLDCLKLYRAIPPPSSYSNESVKKRDIIECYVVCVSRINTFWFYVINFLMVPIFFCLRLFVVIPYYSLLLLIKLR